MVQRFKSIQSQVCGIVEDDDVNKDDKFEFDSTSEVVEYASLGQSELIAIQDVRN